MTAYLWCGKEKPSVTENTLVCAEKKPEELDDTYDNLPPGLVVNNRDCFACGKQSETRLTKWTGHLRWICNECSKRGETPDPKEEK